jgi:hypothetical protein
LFSALYLFIAERRSTGLRSTVPQHVLVFGTIKIEMTTLLWQSQPASNQPQQTHKPRFT